MCLSENIIKAVVIVGAGGFGRETLEIFKDCNKMSKRWEILGFIDEDERLHGKMINNLPVLGGLQWIRAHNNNEVGCVCAIGTCETRKQVVEKLEAMRVTFYNAIHPSVIIKDFVELGKDVIIQAGSILAVNSKIGDHVHINFHCAIGHDAVLGNYCTVSPMVTINGFNRLDEGVYVGAGAAFIQDVSIGKWTTIGAGAAVVQDIPGNVVAVGVPAKVIKKIAHQSE